MTTVSLCGSEPLWANQNFHIARHGGCIFTNYGPAIELAAPGVSLETTTMDGGYGSFGGTSAACPHVVGVAALALAAGVADVRGTLQSTAEDLGEPGWDESYGYGLVDAETAVDTLSAPHWHTVSSTGKLPITWGKLKGK